MSRSFQKAVLLFSFLLLYISAVEGALPGFGKIFSWLGKAKNAKSAGKALPVVLKTGAKTLPAAKISKNLVSTSLAKAAPKALAQKVTPGQILAGGGAVSMVITANGAANAMESVASQTGNAVSQTLTGNAPSSQQFIERSAQTVENTASAIFFYVFLFSSLVTMVLFWRFNLMPWMRAKTNVTSNPKPVAAEEKVAKQDISDAQIVTDEKKAEAKANSFSPPYSSKIFAKTEMNWK